MTVARTERGVRVRRLRPGDAEAVARIDAQHTSVEKLDHWRAALAEAKRRRRSPRVALAAEVDGALCGYILGEVRAFEFGSEPCGWVLAVGVDAAHLRGGVGTRLLAAACAAFRDAGVRRVRTMVERADVPVLSFFRGAGFVAGPFVQLELDLGGETP